ncbi:hypothetical protein B0H19DRAFT_1074545 [Mycena capillaripes]|nr:hypothetical protein B0H19DRAFT_1074545 [Mycena capillaripes]
MAPHLSFSQDITCEMVEIFTAAAVGGSQTREPGLVQTKALGIALSQDVTNLSALRERIIRHTRMRAAAVDQSAVAWIGCSSSIAEAQSTHSFNTRSIAGRCPPRRKRGNFDWRKYSKWPADHLSLPDFGLPLRLRGTVHTSLPGEIEGAGTKPEALLESWAARVATYLGCGGSLAARPSGISLVHPYIGGSLKGPRQFMLIAIPVNDREVPSPTAYPQAFRWLDGLWRYLFHAHVPYSLRTK